METPKLASEPPLEIMFVGWYWDYGNQKHKILLEAPIGSWVATRIVRTVGKSTGSPNLDSVKPAPPQQPENPSTNPNA